MNLLRFLHRTPTASEAARELAHRRAELRRLSQRERYKQTHAQLSRELGMSVPEFWR